MDARKMVFLLETLMVTSAVGEFFDPSENIIVAMRKPKGSHICENRLARLHCGHASDKIRIYVAKYGRDNDYICNKRGLKKARCPPEDRTALLKNFCDHRSSCAVPVNSSTMGVVCPHVDKFLNVIYSCVKGERTPTSTQTTPRTTDTTTAVPSAEPGPKESTRSSTPPADTLDHHWVQVEPRSIGNHGNKLTGWCESVVLLFVQMAAALVSAAAI